MAYPSVVSGKLTRDGSIKTAVFFGRVLPAAGQGRYDRKARLWPGQTEGAKSSGMIEYQIESNTRRCSISGRELKTGERFYSVLLEQSGKFQRRDYSSEVWHGPPEGTFSFWSGRIPETDQPRLPAINEDTLMECFERLKTNNEPDRIRFRYVVTLLLMRRKRLRFEEVVNEGGQNVLSVRCSRTGEVYRVVDPRMTDEEMTAVQDEVLQVLGWY